MENVIQVQTFGTFMMKLNGIPVATGKMHKESQFLRLMQVLLHYGREGIPKEKLEEIVVGDKDGGVTRTALRTVVYKSKQKLKQLGFPDEELFYQDKGIFYWTKSMEIVEDARTFEAQYQTAEQLWDSEEEVDDEALLQAYLDACYLYRGEFLFTYAGDSWVAQESKRYREMFKDCVDKAADLLKQKFDWLGLEKLGRHAASVDLYNDWEVLTMEALVKRGRFEEAVDFHAEVVDKYIKDCGIYPSTKLMDILDESGNQIHHSIEILDKIQDSMTESEVDLLGGYSCSLPVFRGIYQYTLRMLERSDREYYLILCTLVDSKGNHIREEKVYEALSDSMQNCVRNSIRKGDVFCRYGESQYLILVANTSKENCELIQNRISQKFRMENGKIAIKYHVNSVIFEMMKR